MAEAVVPLIWAVAGTADDSGSDARGHQGSSGCSGPPKAEACGGMARTTQLRSKL